MSDIPPGAAPVEIQAGESRFKVSAADIRRYPWQALVASSEAKECWAYSSLFGSQAQALQASGDAVGVSVYTLLQTVASFSPKIDDEAEPYDSMWKGFNGRRALCPDDLVEEDLLALEGIIEDTSDSEMRARLADVVWIRCKKFRAAQLAVPAFLASAQVLKSSELWPRFTQRIERAAQIAVRRGFEELKKQVIETIEGNINEAELDPASELLCHKLMSILLRMGEGSPERYARLSEKLANDFARKGNWRISQRYWRMAESWQRRLRNELEVRRCMIAAAECLVSHSNAGQPKAASDYGYRAHWMGKALESLRQAKAEPDRIQEVHREFLALQKRALSEFQTLHIPEIPGMAEAAKAQQDKAANFVAGYSWEDAFERFIQLARPTNTAELKQQLEEQSEGTVFEDIVATVAIDRTGKVADSIEASVGAVSADKMRKKMVHRASTVNWPQRVTWTIEPARFRLSVEHSIRLSDLRFFVESTPFIPQGHEAMYLRGFLAGFYGDWLLAMHMLVPQVEASIRHVFQQNSVVTSTLNAEGHQEEKDLNQLLWMPEMEKYFGPDMAFDLRGILIDRFGANLRNESAHGLMPESAFYRETSVYLWALLMLLCWRGYRMKQPPVEDNTSSNGL